MTEASSLTALANSLNLKRSDSLAIYGMGTRACDVLDDLKDQVKSTDAIAIDLEQLKKCNDPNAYIGRPTGSTFDRILCIYDDLPVTARHLKKALQICYDLCGNSGMGLITGLDDKATVQAFLHAKHVTKFWHMNQTGKKFDLLFSKDNHRG